MRWLLLPLLLSPPLSAAGQPDTVVVCPADFRPTLTPWLAHRAAQGREVQIVSNLGTADDIRQRIHETATDGRLLFVLLIGDALSPDPARSTPTFRVPATVNRQWGGDADFASDNPYADLDGNGVPELAIGRIPARSAAELKAVLDKILAYERSQDFGPWRSKINLVAGEGGFGALADAALELIAHKCIAGGIPPTYATTMTYANWRSRFCPDPPTFHRRAIERLNEGCLFWVYMGHGSPRELQWAHFPNGKSPILGCDDCSLLACRHRTPIAIFLACHTGAFAEQENCLAEDLLCHRDGPVAVFAGSNVTMPYAMTALSNAAMYEYFVERRNTLGELLLETKRSTMHGYDQPFWALANAVTTAVAPASFRPKQERLEHLQLFNLFGDPTMVLRHPDTVQVTASTANDKSRSIQVRGQCAVDGRCSVELARPAAHGSAARSPRRRYDASPDGRRAFEQDYLAANQPHLATATADVRDGRFGVALPVPKDATGPCQIRVFVEGTTGFAVGSCDVEIAPVKLSGQQSPPAGLPVSLIGSGRQ